MTGERALTVSLEELGLSAYEARAYVALITNGTMSAGDLSFYSEIPRTKIYSTMKKLASKNLAIISNTKSAMMCTAVSPEDAFNNVIHEQIQKVTAMNALVEDLKKAGEKRRKASDSEQRLYRQVGSGSIPGQMRDMIASTKSSIRIMADRWGLGMLAQCRDQLLDALKRGASVRCVISYDQVCSKPHKMLPSGIEIRAARTSCNSIVFDASDVLILDNTDGCGAVFVSSDTLGASQSTAFEAAWSDATSTEELADMTGGRGAESVPYNRCNT